MRLIVAQLGARRNYTVPRILYEAGILAQLYTDVFALNSVSRFLAAVPDAVQPKIVKRFLGRIPPGIPRALISSNMTFGLRYKRRRASAESYEEAIENSLWAGQRFCELVLEEGLPGETGVYTFNSAGLELLSEARRKRTPAIMDQTIAPMEIEAELLEAEHDRYPDWESPFTDLSALAKFAARERAEWEAADRILCGSEFVKDCISYCGGPVEKCRVVPYGIEGGGPVGKKVAHKGPLRVLTVGAVGLRKGSPYVVAAANMMGNDAVFRMVGSIGVKEPARKELGESVELIGPVARREVNEHYAWADVFLLPSICEGSAGVVYEALAAGVPVVCTPNTGSVVRDGVDGFIVPPRDASAIADVLSRFVKSRALVKAMGEQARLRVREFGIEQYKARLLAALTDTGK